MNAINGIADVLSRRDYERESYERHHRKRIVQPKNGAVDVNVRDLHEALQPPENVQHFERVVWRFFFVLVKLLLFLF